MRDAPAAARVVVVLGQSFPVLELMEATLKDSGHRVLATTKPEEVVELARSVRIDVVVADSGDVLEALEEEVRLLQPAMRVVRICEPDEPQRVGVEGTMIARPVSLRELESVVRAATRIEARAPGRRSGYCRAR